MENKYTFLTSTLSVRGQAMSSKFNQIIDIPIGNLEQALELLTSVSNGASIWLSDESLQNLAIAFAKVEEVKYALEDQKDE